MDIFGILTMIGGLALFLFGMDFMGANLSKASGGKLEHILEKQSAESSGAWRRCNGSDPVIFGYHGYGRWFCQFRHHEVVPGDRYYYGCQHRYHHHILDAESDRN